MDNQRPSREEIIASYSLLNHLQTIGCKIKGNSDNRQVNRCPAKQHGQDHFCVSIKVHEQIWHCNDCDNGGSIIDWLSIEQNKTPADVLKELSDSLIQHPIIKPKPVKGYRYCDENGNVLYEVIRYEPKSFRQRQSDGKGGYKWNMEGVRRVLYRLPEILKSQTIAICEGEKDADTVFSHGITATCNVGGAGKWLQTYTDILTGKDIIIFPDNDKAGKAHVDLVIQSLQGKAKSIRKIIIPDPHKDISAYLETISTAELATATINKLIASSQNINATDDVPVQSLAEIESEYQSVAKIDGDILKFNAWIPSLRKQIRRVIAGQLVVVVADTGVGKSLFLQNLAHHSAPTPVLYFQTELPAVDSFERAIQISEQMRGVDVEYQYRLDKPPIQWKQQTQHLFYCHKSRLSPLEIESIILKSEIKIGCKPPIVLVDYIGLLTGKGNSKYEKISEIAEQLKLVAKTTNTIIVAASQVKRPENANQDWKPSLHSAKDSGSIEASCQLMLGISRPAADKMNVEVLKASKGGGGMLINCKLDTGCLRISELSYQPEITEVTQ